MKRHYNLTIRHPDDSLPLNNEELLKAVVEALCSKYDDVERYGPALCGFAITINGSKFSPANPQQGGVL